MATSVVTRRRRGQEFAWDKRASVAATWRTCLTCQPQHSDDTHGERRGRVLRAAEPPPVVLERTGPHAVREATS